MAIEKCCVRWDLEFGFFTCGIITLMVKIYAANIIIFTFLLMDEWCWRMLGVGVFSWLIATVGMQFVSLMGIVLKKSILLQPYFVVLLLEPFTLLIFTIILCVIANNAGFVLVEAFVVLLIILVVMCFPCLMSSMAISGSCGKRTLAVFTDFYTR